MRKFSCIGVVKIYLLFWIFACVVGKENSSIETRQRRLTVLNNGYKLLRSRLRSVRRPRAENVTTTVSSDLIKI